MIIMLSDKANLGVKIEAYRRSVIFFSLSKKIKYLIFVVNRKCHLASI